MRARPDYACQTANHFCQDVHGNLVLQDINGKPPLTATTPATVNICYPITTPTGTVTCFPWPYISDLSIDVRDAGAASPQVPPYLQSLLGNGGPTGWICGTVAQTDIAEYGFATIPTPKPGTRQPKCGTLNWAAW
ncbi:hypothetical protein [Catenulispora rubra]|uniref:hypothetical protein n=1 Tax=Catenulispora rubra TaxID=280293 RepID=UPI001892140B|nr:hypothetical protein [Catenulispora rubra]